jgi:hypothetical protein
MHMQGLKLFPEYRGFFRFSVLSRNPKEMVQWQIFLILTIYRVSINYCLAQILNVTFSG